MSPGGQGLLRSRFQGGLKEVEGYTLGRPEDSHAKDRKEPSVAPAVKDRVGQAEAPWVGRPRTSQKPPSLSMTSHATSDRLSPVPGSATAQQHRPLSLSETRLFLGARAQFSWHHCMMPSPP